MKVEDVFTQKRRLYVGARLIARELLQAAVADHLRWSRLIGQFGGLVKLFPGCIYAASLLFSIARASPGLSVMYRQAVLLGRDPAGRSLGRRQKCLRESRSCRAAPGIRLHV